MSIKRRLAAGVLAFGLIGGFSLATAAPANADGKAYTRSIRIAGYNSYSNCHLGTNSSQLTLLKLGKTVVSASCTPMSNGTWTGVVWYQG